jgi:hypothetical protein
MADTYTKKLLPTDKTSQVVELHESIPLTGSIISASAYADDLNIKNYAHGMFQSVYDYPYLSSSANHILDLTVGVITGSKMIGYSGSIIQETQKTNIYNEMAQILAGFDPTGSILPFEDSGSFASAVDTSLIKEAFFVNFSRLLTKDQIQIQNSGFQMVLGVNPAFATPFAADQIVVKDTNGPNSLTNSPSGEFNVLFASTQAGATDGVLNENVPCGLVFYEAGVALLTASLLRNRTDNNGLLDVGAVVQMNSAGQNVDDILVSGSISGSCDALRHRIYNISFNNTTELNSTIYMCRANFNEFNYSSNPTYLSQSKIRVKERASDDPISYITTVGLYSPGNELLAVAKLSEPLKKTPADEFTLRVRLDY